VTPYHLSVAYRVGPVLVDSRVGAGIPPVDGREMGYEEGTREKRRSYPS